MDIEIGGKRHNKNWLLSSKEGQALLSQSKTGTRPRCVCRAGGTEMYIATRGMLHYMARMPGTADQHSENCMSHIVPSKLYSDDTPDSILHTLLLNVPDSRTSKWTELRTKILVAAEKIIVDGEKLSDCLLVPEFFNKDSASAQRSVFDEFVTEAENEDATQRKWLIATIKDILPSKYGAKLTMKHLPGIKFWAGRDKATELLSLSDVPTILGIFDIKKSAAGVVIADFALHYGTVSTSGKKPASGNSSIETPLPKIDKEEDKFLLVCKRLGLPCDTTRRIVINAMVDFCLEHKK